MGIIHYFKNFISFLGTIFNNRKLLWELTKKELKQRYVGSYLGILWAFIQPAITIFIFWFVFQLGFKSKPVDNFPFILWLVCGMFPWFFFSDALLAATNSIYNNSFLVKKVVFPVSLLPVIQILSALIINTFFICMLFLMFVVYGYTPDIYTLQICYYLLGTICLVFGLSLITSSLAVFSKDVGQIVSMLIQFGFWGTPIFWSLKMIPDGYQWILKLNPMYYIVEGYRCSFIYHQWFWERGLSTVFFWVFTLLIMVVGVLVFRKLRPHFADVL